MTLSQHYSHGTIQGARDYQEDSFGIYLNMDMQAGDGMLGDLLVVCDGMGGHVGGDEASNLVNNVFYETFISHDYDIADCLSLSLNKANNAIAERVQASPEKQGMGTTLIGAVITGAQLYWVSVGDSPMWVLRDGVLTRLNKDHSMAPLLDKMAKMGELTEEEALSDATRNQLRSAVMGENVDLVDLSITPFDLQDGDVVVLATDGVETLNHDRLIDVLEKNRQTPDQAATSLLQNVEKFQDPYQDNATCIVAYIKAEKQGFMAKLFG